MSEPSGFEKPGKSKTLNPPSANAQAGEPIGLTLKDSRFLCEEFNGDVTGVLVPMVRVPVVTLAHSSHSVGTILHRCPFMRMGTSVNDTRQRRNSTVIHTNRFQSYSRGT